MIQDGGNSEKKSLSESLGFASRGDIDWCMGLPWYQNM